MSDCGCGTKQTETLERKTLFALLSINALMFFVELSLGLIAQSTSLIADSLDMLADTVVYSISLYAVGQSISKQASSAKVSGYLQILLGIGVIIEVVRRFIYGSEPESLLIMMGGLAALVANAICLFLISKHRQGGVHMRASWIFSKNDVISNVAVILSGGLVAAIGNHYPDLIVGGLISAIVIRGGINILREANHSLEEKRP
jgi:cation diffusion facilitator family transporter